MRPVVQLRSPAAPPAAPTLPLAALRLRRSLAWPAGQAEAELSPAADLPPEGQPVLMEAGYQGHMLQTLFTGRVLHHQQGLWSTRLMVEEPTGPLARSFIARTVRSGTAAQAMADLCREAGVTFIADGPGALLPAYALLANQSALDHILRLARLSGMLCRTDTAGQLRAGQPLPVPNGTVLRPADPVLDLQVHRGPAPPPAPRIAGQGALGSRGPGAEQWVRQSLDGMTAGDGPMTRLMPGLRTLADVTRAAVTETILAREQATRLTLTMAGPPPGDLAEVILLAGFPAYSGPARIAGIEVLWDAGSGLITILDLYGPGG